MTKAKPKSKTADQDIIKHMAELSERMNYMMETLKTHADVINDHQSLLDRVKTRMGL